MTATRDDLIARARVTNAERDKMERSAGFATPGSGDMVNQIWTAMLALDAALAMKDWDAVAEAYVLLEAIDPKLRPQKEVA